MAVSEDQANLEGQDLSQGLVLADKVIHQDYPVIDIFCLSIGPNRQVSFCRLGLIDKLSLSIVSNRQVTFCRLYPIGKYNHVDCVESAIISKNI